MSEYEVVREYDDDGTVVSEYVERVPDDGYAGEDPPDRWDECGCGSGCDECEGAFVVQSAGPGETSVETDPWAVYSDEPPF